VTVTVSGPQRPPILLTGATADVGGRLLRVLEERGAGAHLVARCLERIFDYRRDAVERLLGGHGTPVPAPSGG